MIASTEPQRCDAAKEHLHPRSDGDHLPHDTVHRDDPPPYLPVDALFQMQLQIHTQGDLDQHHSHQTARETSMDVLLELSSPCLWPKTYPSTASAAAVLCSGTCHRDRTMPRTMPVGKSIPQARIWINMWIHRIVSIGSGLTAEPSGILLLWCSCAREGWAKWETRRGRRRRGSPSGILVELEVLRSPQRIGRRGLNKMQFSLRYWPLCARSGRRAS